MGRLLNCTGCDTPLRSPSEDGRCGLCRVKQLRTTIADLGDQPPASTFAVWSLLERGLPRRVVLLSLAAVRSGVAVDEVTEGLDGLLRGAV